MLQLDLSANVRSTHGKGAARVLRSKGLTPAVLYGSGVKPVSLELDTKSFTKSLLQINRRNAVIDLDIKEGKKKSIRHVVIKELQTHPIDDKLIHADFCEVSLDAQVVLEVPVELTGVSKGVDIGGILQFTLPKVPLRGTILDFPDSLPLDISAMEIEDRLCCKDLDIPEGLELMADEERQVVFVADPAKIKTWEEEEEERLAAEATEAGEAGETAETEGGEEGAASAEESEKEATEE
jgi:large subunit ribosomal protein L25